MKLPGIFVYKLYGKYSNFFCLRSLLMDWSTIPIILQQIEQSPLHDLPNFLLHILDNKRKEYEASAASIKSSLGTHLILNSLLCASQPTVVIWAISICQDTLRQEIIQASDIESGLHFGTSHAHSVNLVEFDLGRIAETFESTTPLTWNLIKMLLDANLAFQYCKQKHPKKDATYTSHHDPQGQPDEILTCIMSRDGGGGLDDGEPNED